MRTSRRDGLRTAPISILIAVLALPSCVSSAKLLGADTDRERYVGEPDLPASHDDTGRVAVKRTALSRRCGSVPRRAPCPPGARLAGALAAVVLALALSACGGEGTDDGADAPRWDATRWDEATWR